LVAQVIRVLLIQIGMQLLTAVRANIEHISASVLADYAAGRVFARTSLCELEEHLLLCGLCQRVVVKLDSDASLCGRPLEITHATADGFVRLWVERSLSGRWLARYTGGQLNGGREFESSQSARTFALQCFNEMFAEHVCTHACSFWP
jgi:hypothetical protein